nr:nitrate reductase subunit beta [Candidatus Pantoea persica]
MKFIMVRKMNCVDWLDDEGREQGVQGGETMKIHSQVDIVLNLDKCIGCHTCSVTCENVWTSREGMEYAWFKNVETKPSVSYPHDWENQQKWRGGWIRNIKGWLVPRLGSRSSVMMKIFANPVVPGIDDYYEPFTYNYQHLHTAKAGKHQPTARPRPLISGQCMDKVNGDPNGEEILGGEFSKRSQDKTSRQCRRRLRPV